ncbi:MAG: hypothetical protein K6A43_11825 [Treponema sp.]|nr:hypothetical protein [Treponema sp.]
MKKLLKLTTLILSISMLFGLASCDMGDNTSNNTPGNPTSQEEQEPEEQKPEEKPKGEPTVPNIAAGYYMTGDWKNLVFLVSNNQALIQEYKDVDAFNRAGTENQKEGDVVASSEISTTLVWYTSEISAYKLLFNGNTYYLYEKNGKIRVDETKPSGDSDVKTLREIPLDADKRTNWLKPDDGIYVSASKAPFGEKTYMYAKVENGATKITLYYNESNTLKDLSGLTPCATINSITYSFVYEQLEYRDNDWIILMHNKAFKIKPSQSTASTISFKAVSAE